jgi:maltose alpha-D-glucosyltransferase/alpha-amylase
MRYVEGLPSKEGGYHRTGSRTPMQWSKKPNKGFSRAAAHKLYLPVDSKPGAPDVASQEGQDGSLLETLKSLIALRHAHPALKAGGAFKPLHFGKGTEPLAYLREREGRRVLVVVHPCAKAATLNLKITGKTFVLPLLSEGVELHAAKGGLRVQAKGSSFGLFELLD